MRKAIRKVYGASSLSRKEIAKIATMTDDELADAIRDYAKLYTLAKYIGREDASRHLASVARLEDEQARRQEKG